MPLRWPEQLQVSTETIRKDLIQLERRSCAGCMAERSPSRTCPSNPPSDAQAMRRKRPASPRRRSTSSRPGRRVPRRRIHHHQPGRDVPGDRDLTVYTNTLTIALALVTRPRLSVLTLGGRVRARSPRSMTGHPGVVRDPGRRRVPRHQLHLERARPDHSRPRGGHRQAADARPRAADLAGRPHQVQPHQLVQVRRPVATSTCSSPATNCPNGTCTATGGRRAEAGDPRVIVTLTPNPSVDLTLAVDRLAPGTCNRASSGWSEPSGRASTSPSRCAPTASAPVRCSPSAAPTAHGLAAMLEQRGLDPSCPSPATSAATSASGA